MHILNLEDWSDVHQIEQDSYNLALLKLNHRKMYDHRFAQFLLSHQFKDLRIFITKETTAEDLKKELRSKCLISKVISQVNPSNEDLLDAESFYEDIAQISMSFLNAINASSALIQLESVWENTCRIFHVDHNEYRLLFTYIGKTTEYLLNKDVNRHHLGSKKSHLVKKKNASIQKVNTGDIAILKGLKKSSLALVHKSPKYENSPRLLLRIDSNPPTFLLKER